MTVAESGGIFISYRRQDRGTWPAANCNPDRNPVGVEDALPPNLI
jgi:hypothetical protein